MMTELTPTPPTDAATAPVADAPVATGQAPDAAGQDDEVRGYMIPPDAGDPVAARLTADHKSTAAILDGILQG